MSMIQLSSCINFSDVVQLILLPSVLWCCWLGIRESIRHVKIERRGAGARLSVWMRCSWFAYGPADATAVQSSLGSSKSRLV